MGLIKPEELLDKINRNEDILIIDVRAFSNYVRGHIPKAYWFYVWDLTKHKEGLPSTLKDVKEMEEILSKNGFDSSKESVIYCDNNSLTYASYLFFVLEYLGYEKARILEGGFEAWVEKNYPLEKGIIKAKQGKFIANIKKDIKADASEVLSKIGKSLIIDTRTKEEFEGKAQTTLRRGRIPTSINLPHQEFITSKPYSLNFEAIKDKLKFIDQNKEIILYCSAGDRATYVYFILKQLKLKPKVYLESFYEWGSKNFQIEL